MEDKQILSQYLGEEKATEALKLIKAYDNYALKFKNKLNKLLEPVNHEVKVALAFTKKEG